jgi:cell division septation protein DedD
MGWLRNNWLDLLIFVLFGLVVAGIVFFLTGINPFQRPQTQTPAPPQPVEQTQPAPAPPPETQPQPQPQPPRPQEDRAGEPVITALPIPQAPSETPQAQPSQRPQERPTTSDQPAAAPSGSWRVAVGSFSNAQNASRLARQLEAQGYRVQLEAAGALTRVTVGPYASEEQARGVARNFAGAQVYRGARPAQPTQGSAQPSAAVYVQVGAFRSQASADALVEKLRAEGLPVVLVKDGSLIRVRVGPLGDDREQVIASLRAMGLPTLAVP